MGQRERTNPHPPPAAPYSSPPPPASSSRTAPPGWMIAVTPARQAISTASSRANGKKASEASTAPFARSPASRSASSTGVLRFCWPPPAAPPPVAPPRRRGAARRQLGDSQVAPVAQPLQRRRLVVRRDDHVVAHPLHRRHHRLRDGAVGCDDPAARRHGVGVEGALVRLRDLLVGGDAAGVSVLDDDDRRAGELLHRLPGGVRVHAGVY